MCRAADGTYEVSVTQIRTIRGSAHTPFDYGNKSVLSRAHVVRIPSADIGVWAAENLQAQMGGHAMRTRKGRVEVTSSYIDFQLLLAPAEGVPNPTTEISGRLLGYGSRRMLASTPCVAAQ